MAPLTPAGRAMSIPKSLRRGPADDATAHALGVLTAANRRVGRCRPGAGYGSSVSPDACVS
jgi:hypothetical protein